AHRKTSARTMRTGASSGSARSGGVSAAVRASAAAAPASVQPAVTIRPKIVEVQPGSRLISQSSAARPVLKNSRINAGQAKAVAYAVLWNAIALGVLRRARPDGRLAPAFAWPGPAQNAEG